MKKRKQKILIAEDQEINRQILRNMLGDEYDIIEATNGQETIDMLNHYLDELAVLLLDIVMPVLSGYDVLNYVQEHGMVHLPIIVMTGSLDELSETKALDLGAWDFVSKPYKPRVLMTRIKNAIARSEMNSYAQVKHIAEHDQLTDLYNRRHFFETTERLLKRHKGEHAVFIRMDINQFRLINSFLGEAGGDALLCFLADELRRLAESYPWYTYGRIESDVFACCIPFDKERCEQELQELIERITHYEKDYTIEPSFGLYEVVDPPESVETMYTGATLAAKESKNKYLLYITYYNDRMRERLRQEQEITLDMQRALDNEEFLVYFQPKYNTQTKTPYGAEALVRWRHPEKGMVSPALFIPVFEKNGFIGKLDAYVWEKVCQYIRGWIDDGLETAPISVNMSRAELSNPHLVDMLVALMERYQISPRLLNLELTESAYMDNPEIMNVVIHKLHKAGFTILMDDFGSGYSSLNTLKDIDVDILKIDTKFLPIDETDTKSRKILVSVIGMAQWLGLPVITEGVETQEQYNFLQSIGCEYIQGYYFARPMPYEEYDDLIHHSELIEAEYHSRYNEEYMMPRTIKDKIYKDKLTGAYNRRYLEEWLFLDLDNNDKGEISLGVIRMDISNLRQISEKKEHLYGWDILKRVSKMLHRHIRKTDAVIRYDSDEFMIVLTSCSQKVVINKVQEIRQALDKAADEYGLEQGAAFGYSYTTNFKKEMSMLKDMIDDARFMLE